MSKLSIQTKDAPAAIGPYSQAVKTDSLLFVSGQVPIVPATGKIVEGGIEEQTHQVFYNLKAVLEAAELNFENVIKTTVLLRDMNDFAIVNKIYAQYIDTKVLPARAAFAVNGLPKDAMVEIELVATL